MDNLYLYILISLVFLAVIDLIVGVSNDAVNFLNSAIGSKVVSFNTIMIVASVGVLVGAMTSSGMMEVARKGIFNPSEFMFAEIMIIFMAVMLTDILLLDFFNTLGLPTSTTVSIVFELLGASVAVALIKIYSKDSSSLLDLSNYINIDKAIQIILGILLSVIVAFTIGAVVQYLSRIFLTFNFKAKPIWYSAVFSGFANTFILYFIIVKGLKNTTFIDKSFTEALNQNPLYFAGICFVILTTISLIAMYFFKAKIYTIIILIGTFALAVAFAGNDLVNFIGVPIAAYDSYNSWISSGNDAHAYVMSSLSLPIKTEPYFLLIAGLIMVLTLWFSSKAKTVVKTSVDLSRQNQGSERFKPNFLSRLMVRFTIGASFTINRLLPKSFKDWVNIQYQESIPVVVNKNTPAFDLVRAAVNLMVASILISIATSMQLPLSTTYVTFMVAMGTSLADRAWSSESAVYRVAGVLNVIGGWFFTALSAFLTAAIMAYILFYGKTIALISLFVLSIVIIARSYTMHRKGTKKIQEKYRLEKAESKSTQGVIYESASNIANVIKRSSIIYTSAVKGLARQNLTDLKKTKKQIETLSNEIENLKDNIFYFIKNLEEPSLSASNFYINILGYLQDMAQSLEYISKASHKHVNNNHRKLRFSQIRELKDLDNTISALLKRTEKAFSSHSFNEMNELLALKQNASDLVSEKIQMQIERTRKDESSPKNTTLYFSLLSETKDLLKGLMNLLEEYYNSHDSSIKPEVVMTSETISNKSRLYGNCF